MINEMSNEEAKQFFMKPHFSLGKTVNRKIVENINNGEVFTGAFPCPYNPAETINTVISSYVKYKLEEQKKTGKEIEDIDYFTDSIAETIEKLVICNIRAWMLEDKMSEVVGNDKLTAGLKMKIDQNFKVKRPKLIAAINKMMDQAILKNKTLEEPSVKLYKGFDTKENSS